MKEIDKKDTGSVAGGAVSPPDSPTSPYNPWAPVPSEPAYPRFPSPIAPDPEFTDPAE